MTEDARLAALERLVRLRDANALTPQEFEAEKRRFLTGGSPASAPPVETARYEEPVGDTARGGAGRLIALALAVAMVAALASWLFIGTKPVCPSGKCVPVVAAKPIAGSPPPVVAVSRTRESVDLTDTLRFADVKECKFTPSTERLFGSLQQLDDQGRPEGSAKQVTVGPLSLPIAREKVALKDGEPGSARYDASVRFPEGTNWQGLQLSRVMSRFHSYVESDSSTAKLLIFHDSSSAVRAALAKAGVSVPIAPAYRELHDATCGGSMSLVPMNGGTALQCGWGC